MPPLTKTLLTRRTLVSIAAIAFLVHARALGAGLVFDDRGAILENPVVQGDLDLGALFGTDFWGRPPGEGPGTWRPLVVLSFWLDKHLFGDSFHVTNVLMHAGTTVLFALALARRTGRERLAIVAALAFGVLGIGTEAVAGVVGRADVMAAGLGFLSWLLWSEREGEPVEPRRMAGAALAFAGALASKESAIVLPLLFLLADVLLAPAGKPVRIAWKRYVPLLGAGAAVLGLRALFFGSLLGVTRDVQANPLVGEGFAVRLWTSLRLFGMALQRIVAPVNLSADYSYAAILPDRSPFALGVLLGAVALGAVVAAAIVLRRKEPVLSLAAVTLLVPWLVMSQVVFALPTIFAERLLYLPAAGLAIAIGRLGEWALERRAGAMPPAGGKKKGKGAAAAAAAEVAPIPADRWRMAALVVGPLLVGNAVLTWGREAAWRSERTLFAAAIETTPSSARAWNNYGTALLNERQAADAIGPLERAITILPTWSEPHAQLGVALLEAGRPVAAEEHFRKAVQLDPELAKAVFNLSVYLARQQRYAEAAEVLRPFVAKFPGRAREAALLRQIEADLASGGGKR
ncbi:tetratricopeptide repeat protein [Polyangium aurulentum]|uniref:tetratricopeptide repeat protein n=1 Tax=Polyangium aurulentum TaxID=2567896 RepID=UPI0010AE34E0|nr:tetratricopeptide repeat protein [Polyangium aurulentum]UQA58854.1 tetratricopeptide repeat protein [Polyangium aurulentum]